MDESATVAKEETFKTISTRIVKAHCTIEQHNMKRLVWKVAMEQHVLIDNNFETNGGYIPSLAPIALGFSWPQMFFNGNQFSVQPAPTKTQPKYKCGPVRETTLGSI